MSFGGGGGGGTTVQVSKPWGPLRGPIKGIIGESRELHKQDVPSFVPFSPESESALSGIAERAAMGSPQVFLAKKLLDATTQGDFLNPESNPNLQGYFNAAAGNVEDRVNAEFSKAGRYGSGKHEGVLGRELSRLASSIYGPAYQQERGLQMQAASMAPIMAAQDYTDLGKLGAVGAMREGKAYEEQQDPYEQIRRYAAIINSLPGGQTQTSGYNPGFAKNALNYGVGTAGLMSLFG